VLLVLVLLVLVLFWWRFLKMNPVQLSNCQFERKKLAGTKKIAHSDFALPRF
jgi:hypothetical protein